MPPLHVQHKLIAHCLQRDDPALSEHEAEIEAVHCTNFIAAALRAANKIHTHHVETKEADRAA